MINLSSSRIRRFISISLVLTLAAVQVSAGLIITRSNGIAVTGADGISFINTSGIAVTGADGMLAFAPNGIATTGADGIAVTGADGVTHTGTNGIAVTGADGIAVTGADGIAVTGADGIAVTGADGKTFRADSIYVTRPTGIAVTGADGIAVTGADGIAVTGADAVEAARADGMTVEKASGIAVTGADGIAVTGADGVVYTIPPQGIAVTGADGIAVTGAGGIAVTGADGIAVTGADTLVPGIVGTGLQSVDPELAVQLDKLSDDSNVNAIVVYHQLPNDADIADLQRLGIIGGTRYRALPMIALTATKSQLISISRLPAVRSIYGNRTLQLNSDPYMKLNGAERVPLDADLTQFHSGVPLAGRNVTVAVLDTGVDGTHSDLAGRVVQNVKLLDQQSASVGFVSPSQIENLANTDQAYGHGTFVAGVIAGSGARSGGRYAGVAPEARIVGLSAGDLTLSFVLSGFDYLLSRGANLNVRVVNCSFSSNTVFDTNDPVNVATKLLAERGIATVFSAGNTGPGNSTLNPYAVAPWVISVGATDARGRLADFSSRGTMGSALFRPTLVAPGVSLISLRSSGLSLTGTLGVAGADTSRLAPDELPWYTTASGTSFSAPQVAATMALMLEANPNLTPAQMRDILQRTATPIPANYRHEVGAGMLNAHAAVLEAAFPQRRMGQWRAALDRGQVNFTNDPTVTFTGTVQPGQNSDTNLTLPENTLLAAVQIAWGPLWSTNDLGLALLDPAGTQRASSNYLNLPGLTGKRERVTLSSPAAGTWRARVSSTLNGALTAQPFTGTLEVTRVEYSPLDDLGNLSSQERSEVYQALRSFVMTPFGRHFRPSFGVTRSALAAAMVQSGCVPQYVAAQPRFNDVRDLTTRNFVESAQAAPDGALFDVVNGSGFRPNDVTDRLTAAVVLVRAAGLRAEAEAQAGATLTVTDALSIPASLRGYVAVALSRGLMTTTNNAFRPQSPFVRLELAHALATLQTLR
ncbi:MAG TPA: S8 family serine peptidase [Blastocatellia bacterium]|nr:S8 family serine peptidase [Blastocatellia bacterium]